MDQLLDRNPGPGVPAAEKLPSLSRVQNLARDALSAEPGVPGVRSGVGSPLAAVGLSPRARRLGRPAARRSALPGGRVPLRPHLAPSGHAGNCTRPGSCLPLASSCHGRAGVSGWRIKDKALIPLLPPATTKPGSVAAPRVPQSLQCPAGGWHFPCPCLQGHHWP